MDIEVKHASEEAKLLEIKYKELQGRILGFRNLLKIESVHTPNEYNLLPIYDDWFDISVEMEGRTW